MEQVEEDTVVAKFDKKRRELELCFQAATGRRRASSRLPERPVGS